MEKLPRDMLLKILIAVEDRTRLSDEELKKRIEKDKKELNVREEKRLEEKNKNIRNILLQFDLFSDIFDHGDLYEKCKEYIKNGDWSFGLYSNGDLKNHSHLSSSFSNFVNLSSIRGKYLADYIRDYLDEDKDNENDQKKDKWNIFYSNVVSGGQENKQQNKHFKKERCESCPARQVSNYGCDNLYLFDTGFYGEVDLYETSQINNGICLTCKNKGINI